MGCMGFRAQSVGCTGLKLTVLWVWGAFNGLGGLAALAFRALRVVGCCSCLRHEL